MNASARISDDGLYRYELSRQWADKPTLCWVMLNPSTADAEQDDPTIRRCIGFSDRWGYGGIVVVNLFALRATRPIHLNHHPDPVGPDNDEIAGFWIRRLPTIAAWGAHRLAEERASWFVNNVGMSEGPRCLGLTKNGNPRHPLYVAGSTEPEPFARDEIAAAFRRNALEGEASSEVSA